MKETTRHFLKWLMGLTLILRCFVIALLVHVALLFLLATIKVGGIAARAISAAFETPTPAGTSVDDGDINARYRDVDYDPPGVKGPTPPTTEFKVAIAQPSPSTPVDASDAEVIGVVSDSAAGVARLQGTVGAISAPTFGGGGEGLIGVIGGTGKGPWDGRLGPARTRKTPPEAERAVMAALRWLKNNQKEDGSWNIPGFPDAGTSLALLAFLGHGHTPDDKEFGGTVNRAISWLTRQVEANKGFVVRGGARFGYTQGVGVLALAEAYGMTQAPAIRKPLEKAVAAILTSQKANPTGAWRYTPNAADADTSTTGWAVMGLKSAKLAGIEIPQEAFDKASAYLWKVCNSKSGGFGYSGANPTPAMTGVGVLCQQFLGHYADPRIKLSLDYLKNDNFDWGNSAAKGWPIYGWYYITQAMFQGGGQYWEHWHNKFQKKLIAAQKADGSWEAFNAEEKKYGPVYATTLSCLMLEVYYRYTPLYQEMEKGARGSVGK